MALSTEAQKSAYPLALYNFRVKVAEVSMSFTEVTGLAAAYEHVTYRHGLSFREGEAIATFNFDEFVTLTCKRGVIAGASPLFLYEWLQMRDPRSLEVSLCDELGSPVVSWKVAAAVPISLKAPAFNASTNEAAIDTVELKARGVSVVKQ